MKKIERRIEDMLAVKAPLWKIAEILEISEITILRHYGHILKQHDRTPGPKPHEPSPETRNRVKLMSIAGISREDIAKVMGFCVDTLSAHYYEELELAAIEANSRVAGNLLMMATGPRELKTTVTAAIWWTKARMAWKDTSRVENTGADGGPMQVENQVVVVLPSNGRDEDAIDVEAESVLPQLPAPDVGDDDDDE